MASGISRQLAKQIGEALAVAELGRRGLIATSFSGNCPAFDILAINERGQTKTIQVKTIRRGNWQFDIKQFFEIEFHRKSQVQKLKRKKKIPVSNLICMFIKITNQNKDEFYICRWDFLQKHLRKTYFSNGIKKRPRRPESTHCKITVGDLQKYQDNWRLIL
jgi:hypothetical protein